MLIYKNFPRKPPIIFIKWVCSPRSPRPAPTPALYKNPNERVFALHMTQGRREMMHWFEAEAPIRKKTAVAFGILVGLIAFSALVALVRGDWIAAGTNIVVAALAGGLSLRFRTAICDPYVNTVVRMEGLAAGDLDSTIAYTDYKDCVGRMTRAMFTFRDTAQAQIASAAEQAAVVATLRTRLESLTHGDFTADIDADFPPSLPAPRSLLSTPRSRRSAR